MSKPLLFNGKPFDPFKPTVTHIKIKDFLERNPGEVFSREELTHRAVVGKSAVNEFRRSSHFAKYIFSVPERHEKTVYGAPQALKRFQAILAGQQ